MSIINKKILIVAVMGIVNCVTYFLCTAHLGLGFNTLFVQYYNVICRPSDHTVGRPRAERFEPGTGDLEADLLKDFIINCYEYQQVNLR